MNPELVEGYSVGSLRSPVFVKFGGTPVGYVVLGTAVKLELEGSVGAPEGDTELVVVFVPLRIRVALTV